MPLRTSVVKRAQRSPSRISTEADRAGRVGDTGVGAAVSGTPSLAAISRARPKWP